MGRASPKDKVLIHFTGRLLDGRVVDSSKDRGAVELQLGNGSVPPGLERAIVGMESGEKKSTIVKVQDAFGPRRTDLILRINAAVLPPDVNPQVGEVLTMQNDKGVKLNVQVTEVTPSEIVLDGNHPLAGHDVTFDIELVRILNSQPLS